jgi:hypothetical protein
MDDATYATELRYLRTLSDLLGLRDWHITLSRASADTDNRAQVSIHRGKDEADVTLSAAWLSYSPEQRRLTLCHELLHMHTGRLCRVVTRLHNMIDEPALEYARKAHDEEEEIVVQRLARILAPYLPLPTEVTS